MGAFLDKPKTEKHTAHGGGNGLRFGLSSMQGWRVEMEDAHTAAVGLPGGLDDWSFFAVYDGHARLPRGQLLLAAPAGAHHGQRGLPRRPRRAGGGGGEERDPGGLPEDRRPHARLLGPAQRAGPQRLHGGGGAAVAGPPVLHQLRRLAPCSAATASASTARWPSPRALGDYDYKCVDGKGPTEQLVSPEPEVFEIARAPEDEFLVLACDGIWDVMSNEELCDFVRSRLEVCDDLERVCNSVVDTCLHKGSRDNMSVVLVCLPNAPKVSEEAKKKEAELDKYLESRVEEIMETSGEDGLPDLGHVMRTLASETIPNLPPGGGLASKRSVVEAAYSRINPHREEDGESEEAEEGSNSTHLREALRQFRISHRGQYRQVLEEALSTICLLGEAGKRAPAPPPATKPRPRSRPPRDPRTRRDDWGARPLRLPKTLTRPSCDL
ncbi:hypothetical protein ANANG_G00046600 [Anguilla anguilla]|uniref:PPM-type phosphatase domain-containing protein n=1 Tax=Anguilla anguilla TaxID=7936 RepID=A0A9D3S9U9_ANGAN|nr:hypothetical protein ANANG_G00046600 [Anguilla anguilla]